jgi:alcohol dehydrogenase (cytochrome c)
VRHEGNWAVPRHRAREDKVIANLPDGRAIAINRDLARSSGQEGRPAQRVRQQGAHALRADRRGKIIVANGAGDAGTRGWVAALDANTGNELWRWYSVPAPGQPGSETWRQEQRLKTAAAACGRPAPPVIPRPS